MELAALVLYVVGLAVCFGVRTWQHSRATGDAGFRRPPLAPRTAAWWGAVLFVAALIAGLGGPLLGSLGVLDPWSAVAAVPGLGWTGLAVAAVGFLATVAAQGAMGASWRIGVRDSEETALVTAGVFRWSRNPIFAAMVIAVLGLTLAVPNVVQAIALVVLVVAIELQVRKVEEPYLLRIHRADYVDYAAQVGRFIPLVGRLSPSSSLMNSVRTSGGET